MRLDCEGRRKSFKSRKLLIGRYTLTKHVPLLERRKASNKKEDISGSKAFGKKCSEKITYRNFRLCILRDHVPSLINSESTSSSSTHSPHERRKLLCPIDCIALHQTDKQTRAKKKVSPSKRKLGEETKTSCDRELNIDTS